MSRGTRAGCVGPLGTQLGGDAISWSKAEGSKKNTKTRFWIAPKRSVYAIYRFGTNPSHRTAMRRQQPGSLFVDEILVTPPLDRRSDEDHNTMKAP
jgi:hypothetical protein